MRACCCVTLKTGSILIGTFELVSWTVVLILSIYSLIMVQNDFGKARGPKSASEMDNIRKMLTMSMALSIGLAIVRITNATILLIGALRASIPLTKVWICVKILATMLNIFYFAQTLFWGVSGAGSTTFYIIILLASFYFLYVVYSFLKELKAEREKRPIKPKF